MVRQITLWASSLASKRIGSGGPVLAVAMLFLFAVGAIASGVSIFTAFPDDSGNVQSATDDPTLDASNKFFSPSVGTNGQACVTCHQPAQGFTIHVSVIDSTFAASGATDPLFRANDTANNPHTTTATADDYSLFLNLGVVRVGKNFPANPDFTAVAADSATNIKFAAPEHFPLLSDPQHPGTATLSLFRRPLVNTNVHLDSSVLWDGRASIDNMQSQVSGAVKTLLLGPGTDVAANQDIANFMLGVFSDQVSDTAAGHRCFGQLHFHRARG